MTKLQPWSEPRLNLLEQWALAAAAWFAARLPGQLIAPQQFRVLLSTRLVMDGRGGPFGTAGNASGLVKLALPLVYAVLGLLVGLMLWRQAPAPWLWMTIVQLFANFTLAVPLLQEFDILLDVLDEPLLAHHPVSPSTRLAARIAHVTIRVSPAAAAAVAGPLVIGLASYPPLAILLVVPLATALTVLTMASGLVVIHTSALATLGQRAVDRASTWLQVFLGACLMGASGLAVPLIVAPLFALGATLAEGLHPLLFALPAVQLGGLFELACGHVTTDNIVLGILAVLVPAALLALAIVLRSVQRRSQGQASANAAASSAHQALRWPRGLSPWITKHLGATPQNRAGFALALAATSRERVIIRWYWQVVLGSMALVFLCLWRIAAPLSTGGHWLVLLLWLLMGFYGYIALALRLSGTPDGAWAFYTVSADHRDSLVAGAFRGAWLTLGLPLSIALLLLPTMLFGWRVLPDVLFMLMVSAILTVESIIGSAVSHFLDQERMPLTAPLRNPPRAPVAGLSRGSILLIGFTVVIAVHPLLHLRWWLVACAAPLLTPLVLRAWRRLSLVKVASEYTASQR